MIDTPTTPSFAAFVGWLVFGGSLLIVLVLNVITLTRVNKVQKREVRIEDGVARDADVKRLEQSFERHIEDDKATFTEIKRQLELQRQERREDVRQIHGLIREMDSTAQATAAEMRLMNQEFATLNSRMNKHLDRKTS